MAGTVDLVSTGEVEAPVRRALDQLGDVSAGTPTHLPSGGALSVGSVSLEQADAELEVFGAGGIFTAALANFRSHDLVVKPRPSSGARCRYAAWSRTTKISTGESRESARRSRTDDRGCWA
jgi:hypothetical protein